MGKVLAPLGILLGAATWFLLFVILGFGLGTAFIAGGVAAAAGIMAAAMALATPLRPILDTPVSSTGVLLGVATFVILEVVLSVTMWIGVVAGLAAMGLYGIVSAAFTSAPEAVTSGQKHTAPATSPWVHNGHDRTEREPVGAR